MAKKIVVEYVDDLDGTSLASDDVHTVEWSWRGVDYVIDTSATNLDKIENGKVPFAKVLKSSTRRGGRRSPAQKRRTAESNNAAAGISERALIRAWAREQGYLVGDRGRLSAEIVAAYREQAATR